MYKTILFRDYPDFQPNLTPRQMFKIGIMGGSYFRTIQSPRTNKIYKNRYKKYKSLNSIPKYKICGTTYNKNINLYKVKVGCSYDQWMEKYWIKENIDPYGWIEWYINFYEGRRCKDDERQIKRWKALAGKNGRFFVRKKKSRKILQTLIHWGVYVDLTLLINQ